MRCPPAVITVLAAGSKPATMSFTHSAPAGWKSALRSRTLSTGHTPVATSV